MIDREKSRHLALRFDGQLGAPRTDEGWRNLINAIESAGSEYSASRVVARLRLRKHAPVPADILGALAADKICPECDDTGWKQKLNSKHTCLCVKNRMAPEIRQECHNCKGKGFTLGPAAVPCHCRTAKAAAS